MGFSFSPIFSKNYLLFPLGIAVLVLPLSVYSDIYAGVAVGSTHYSFENENASSFEVTAGSRLSRHLSVEMSFINLGSVDWYPADAQYNVSGLNVALKASLPIAPDVDIYSKLGLFAWEAEVEYDSFTEPTSHGQDGNLGLGLSWYIADELDFNVEYKTFDFEEMGDSYGSNISTGITFRF